MIPSPVSSISLLMLFLTVSLSDKLDLKTLKQVHLLWRHGDRTPIKPYPTDPYLHYDWPGGLGQLTVRGMQRHHQLGEWIRRRYTGWLNETYDRADVVVRSTDTDRTLMSALANLAGMFPPAGAQVWDKEIPWQPIPVHTLPQDQDYLLSSHAKCPRFEELQQEIQEGEWMKDLYKQNEALFKYVSRNVGQEIVDIVKLDYIYDTLLIENATGLKLPPWTQQVFPGDGTFKKLRDLSFTVDTLTEELKRLKGGPWLKEIIAHSDAIARNDNNDHVKLYIYSAHDTTVAPMLHTMGIFNGVAPPYASMIMVEMMEVQNQGLMIQVLYHNESGHDPYVMTIPGCQPLCPLDKFKHLTSRYIPDNILDECGLSVGDSKIQQVTLVAAIASSVMAASVLVAVLVGLCCKKTRPDQQLDFPGARYHRVQTDQE